jgi:hypothetical protein
MEIATNNQLTIVDELKNKIGDIKDRIKGEGVSNVVFNELTTQAKFLQDKLDGMLKKGGLFTQSDVNDAYEALRQVKRSELEIESKRAFKRLYIYVGVALLVGAGLFMYLKKK